MNALSSSVENIARIATKQDAVNLFTNADNIRRNFPDGVILPLYFGAPFKPLAADIEHIFDECVILVSPLQRLHDRCEATSFLIFLPVPAGLTLSLSYYGAPSISSVMQHFIGGLTYAAEMAEKCTINSQTMLHVRLHLPEEIDNSLIMEKILSLGYEFKKGVNGDTKIYTEGYNYKPFIVKV